MAFLKHLYDDFKYAYVYSNINRKKRLRRMFKVALFIITKI